MTTSAPPRTETAQQRTRTPTHPTLTMLPPDERRCTALTIYKSGDRGPRCKNWRTAGLDVCAAHRENSISIGYRAPTDAQRCTGTTKNGPRTGQRCIQYRMQGQTVCGWHGGKAPQARKAAAKRIAEAELTKQANRLLVRLGAEPVDNPLTTLAELAGEARALKDALGERVNNLRDDIRYESKAGGEQLRAEVGLYERSLDRLGRLLVQIAALNLDERLVRIEEAKAAIVIGAVIAALEHAGITGQQMVEACEVAARHLERARR